MNTFDIKKNLLDLEHSENLSRGITEIGIASGGFIAIVLSVSNKNLMFAIIMAILFSSLFLMDGVRKLNKCKEIRDKIESFVQGYIQGYENI